MDRIWFRIGFNLGVLWALFSVDVCVQKWVCVAIVGDVVVIVVVVIDEDSGWLCHVWVEFS